MIFEPSGMPIPTEEEVRFEAREIVNRNGWGLPLIEALRKVKNPYWGEALTRCIMEKWNELVRDKNEATYYYDSDGDVRYSWADAAYDFGRIIRHCTAAQVAYEQTQPEPLTIKPAAAPIQRNIQVINNYYINQNNGPIITDSNVSIYKQ